MSPTRPAPYGGMTTWDPPSVPAGFEAVLLDRVLQALDDLKKSIPSALAADLKGSLQALPNDLRQALANLPAELQNTLRSSVADLRQQISELPVPQVHVDAPDLSEIVQAVVGLKPGADAQDIAKALKAVLVPQSPADFTPVSATLEALQETLKKLEFRLRAPQTHVAGPGSVAIRYTQAGDLKVNPDGSINVNSSASGGGAVTVADGADVAQGTTTDTEATGNGTIVGLLKRLRTLLNGGLPTALASSGGLKVDIAGTGSNTTAVKTDGSAVTQPVSGTFWQATQPVSGTVTANPGNTANSTPWLTTQSPATAGGLTTFHLAAAGSTNATVVKGSAGQLYGWYVYNSNAAARKVAFHNASSTPTAGASVFFSVVIPPTSGANVEFTNGIAFSTGISITTVTGLADNDATAVAANDLVINLFYK